jgi:hypothetical protein
MGWSVEYDECWKRDIGYGVPGICDHPDCNVLINRGLAHVCGGEPYGGDRGCGLFFCGNHLHTCGHRCERCAKRRKPFLAKPDCREWIEWKLAHPSWAQWREENPGEVAALQTALEASSPYVHVPAATECSAVFGRDCTFCRNATTGCVSCVRCGRMKLVICGQEVRR